MEGRSLCTYSRRLQRVVILLQRVVDITTTRSNNVSHSLVVLATRSKTCHLIGQCLQRVVENYYALQSTRIGPQRPAILMQIISPLLLLVLLKYDHAPHDLIAETGIPSNWNALANFLSRIQRWTHNNFAYFVQTRRLTSS